MTVSHRTPAATLTLPVEAYEPDIEKVLISSEEIEAKLVEMGEAITRDYDGRSLLLVEDIVDSGLTLKYLLKNLAARKPASLEVAAMLRKTGIQKVPLDLRYIGFDIPPEFVVGYGLDYAERFRNLPYVATHKPEAYGGA